MEGVPPWRHVGDAVPYDSMPLPRQATKPDVYAPAAVRQFKRLAEFRFHLQNRLQKPPGRSSDGFLLPYYPMIFCAGCTNNKTAFCEGQSAFFGFFVNL